MKNYFLWFIVIAGTAILTGILFRWYARERQEQARPTAFKGPYLGPIGFAQELPAAA